MGNIISVVLHLSCIICRNNVTHVKGPNKPWLLWFFFLYAHYEGSPFWSDLCRLFGFLATKDFKMILLSNVLALSVHDEGYSINASCAL